MQVTGTIKVLQDTQVVNDKGFRKREFVLTTDEHTQYPQHVSFQCTQDRCNLLDGVQVGETITVHFNLRGREWKSPKGETKYLNSLEAWKIEKGQSGGGGYSNQPAEYETAPPREKDDLPF